MTEIFGSNPFDILPHIAALATAYLLAFPLGWNREKEERSAGLRTFPLVAMAACGFVQAAETVMAHDPGAMARVLEGIIAGMGFIGGGAILKQRNSVKGTATAASLWATGAMGTAVGLGSYDVALVLSLITLLTLWFLSPLKSELIDEPEAEGEGGDDGRSRRKSGEPS
ncbi:MAG TPA: MgtC/SapB family protein [Allosphingosinicella sp.]|nr:MgtC/SapB family protein [Allosphingosinicella sp.]